MKPSTIHITELKTQCSRILDEVARHGRSYIVTKRGKQVARVVPIESLPQSKVLGRWKGLVEIRGDIVHSDWSNALEATRCRVNRRSGA